MSKYAVVAARGLGDALLSMIVSHNIKQSGYPVTTYSTVLCGMADWFPEHTLLPFPSLPTFSHFDRVIAADHSMISREDAQTTILWEREFDRSKTMVENLAAACKRLGYASDCKPQLQIPSHLTHRKESKRILLHPTSSDERKNWHPHKFRKLAASLQKQGYEPVFCVSPSERTSWPEAPLFPTISALAAFIYESGALIGNDSGLGHLASLLGIPTLSLFARKSYAQLWRPGWGKNRVVTPYFPLIGAPMKQRYWKELLFTKQVLNGLDTLIKREGG